MALADSLGLLRSIEWRTIDWRYASARSRSQPISDQVCLVGIDDASLDSIGRWPWPRELLALAVEELAFAGARTVALDLLLSESEVEDQHGQQSGTVSTVGDERLAAALGRVRGVLGLHLEFVDTVGPEWRTAEGASALDRLTSVLSQEIDLAPEIAADRAVLSPPLRDRFLARPLEFKWIAAAHAAAAQSLKGDLGTLPEFQHSLTGGRDLASFDASSAVERAWSRARSWKVLVARHRTAPRGGSYRDTPPIFELSSVASGVGVVTSDAFDGDGVKRRTLAFCDSPAGQAIQFGVAAAAVHLGLPPDQAAIEGDILRVGESTIPIREGAFALDWPTSTFDGFPRLQPDRAGEERPAIALGRLVSLARERTKLAAYLTQRDQLLAELAAKVGVAGLDLASAESVRTAKDRIEDWSFELDSNNPAEAESASKAARLMKLDEYANEGAKIVAAASAEVRRAVEGRLVFIGWTATGALADQMQTPFGPRTPGVFVHAVAADMVLAAHHRRDTADWARWAAILTMGLLSSIVAARFPAPVSFVLALGIGGAYLYGAGVFAFDEWHVVWPLAAPLGASAMSWVAGTAAVAVIASKERARVTRQFQARVAPELVARLSENPGALSVGGESREITIIFGDLAGFTTIAEQLGGAEVVRTLNLYMSCLAEELVKRDAYVNKFLGDGFMAFWSAFGDDPLQETKACQAALACQRAVADLGKQQARSGPAISLRLGIATGMAVVGDCGAPPRLNDYTAIGDSVNLAARLESANKQFGSSILIDGATRRAVGEELLRLKSLGRVVVMGQSKPIDLFEVIDESVAQDLVDLTLEATTHFSQLRFAESQRVFTTIEQRFGSSKLTRLFLEAIAEGSASADGVLRLKAK